MAVALAAPALPPIAPISDGELRSAVESPFGYVADRRGSAGRRALADAQL